MPPGQGGSTSGNVDRATVTTIRRRCYRRSTEKMSPANAEFERQVAAVAAKQEEERTRQMYALLVSTYWNTSREESDEDDYYQNQKSDSDDFLEGTFLKISSDKQKATRNKKNSKNKKKKRSKSRKQFHASEMLSELHTKPSSTCVNAASGDALPFSSSNVAIDLSLLEYSSSSSSISPVTELINPLSSASSSNSWGNSRNRGLSLAFSLQFRKVGNKIMMISVLLAQDLNEFERLPCS